MSRLLAIILFLHFSIANASSDLVIFKFGQDPGGAVTCDGTGKGDESPIECSFVSGSTKMVISRANWNGDAILIKDDDTVEGLCSGSVRKHDNVTSATYSLDPTCIVIGGVKFFFNDEGGDLTCNGQVKQHDRDGINCLYDEFDKLLISRVGWKGDALLIKGESITGQCAGAFKRNATQSDWYNVDQACTASYVRPVQLTTTPMVDEWYTDLPWHQKLSTKDSNLIDTPFVLPYVALQPGLCKIKKNNEIDEPRCMLRYGVLNIMAMHRTDRLYGKGEAPTDEDCEDCVQVKVRIQRLNTLTDNADGFQADVMRNLPYKNLDTKTGIPSITYVINEATVFAPWRPWYTGHYCAQKEDDVADSVCYEDYFTTQLIATSTGGWLWDAPAVFDPKNEDPIGNLKKFCASDNDYCDMYLGKIDWITKDPKITVTGCGSDPKDDCTDCGSDPIADCTKEVEAKTASLDSQFNTSIKSYVDDGRYPWPIVNSDIDLTKDMDTNPFIGFYELERFTKAFIDKDGIPKGSLFRGTHYVLPKKCTKAIYLGARQGNQDDIERLADCVLNFEIHTNGYYRQWRYLYGETDPVKNSLSREQIITAVEDITKALPGINANQYGRTLFLYAGVPEQHLPVSFKIIKGDEYTPDMSLYDKVYNASIYTQYLPMVNVADQTLFSKSYANDFWHAVLMSNHMNQTPDHFIRGIRGRTLWHNEYRSNIMYNSAEHVGDDKKLPIAETTFEKENALGHVDFPAGFQVANATAPFHGNTCDACHIRNGSGIPLMPNGKLPQIHVDRGMKKDQKFEITKDYTYSNKVLPSMKLVLFDLGSIRSDGLYSNKIMNFYGDSFHVNQKNELPTYSMKYVDIKTKGDYEVVDKTPRYKNHLINLFYEPQQIVITDIDIGNEIVCRQDGGIAPKPPKAEDSDDIWPRDCQDVSGSAISDAINGSETLNKTIGFMHLLGRRLGNTPMIEMIPDQVIKDTQAAQKIPGNYSLVSGTRGGGKANFRDCSLSNVETQDKDCYLSRWGWIGDRASLEDQIANAANVEMNMTSKDSYHELHSSPPDNPKHLVRYNKNVCGPADAYCKKQAANSDITEQEIKDMATYQRWIGIPNRSEYQVSSMEVIKGEEIFRRLECNSCHVIDKIAFIKNDNMLPDEERNHLEKLKIQSGDKPEYPFISYLGTDLLMHDMGYLSQIAAPPKGHTIRNKDDGTVKDEYKAYVQTIRTPALKGLRFNRFVTDSNHNTTVPLNSIKPFKNPKAIEIVSGCDFLLHDGRACDAIEAAFLHDGPAIKELDTINRLNDLDAIRLDQLRAFLYSL